MRKVERGEDFGAFFAGAKARRPGPIPQQREDNTWGTLVRYEEHPGLPWGGWAKGARKEKKEKEKKKVADGTAERSCRRSDATLRPVGAAPGGIQGPGS